MTNAETGVRDVAVRKLLLVFGLSFGLIGTAIANGVGQVTHLSGVLSVKREGGSRVLSVKSDVREGDLLATQQDTFARVKFNDGGELVLRPGSQLKIDAYTFAEAQPEKDNLVMSLLKGGFRAVTGLIGKRSRDNVAYRTPTATIGVRGTHFGVLLCTPDKEDADRNDCAGIPTLTGQPPANGLHVDVASGIIVVSNQGGQTQVATGQFGFVASSVAAPVLVPAENGVPVTIPPSINSNNAGGRSIGGQGQTECAL